MQTIRGNAVLRRPTRRPETKTLLDGVRGQEIDWNHAGPQLGQMTATGQSTVYFISEVDTGFVKVGTAINPVKRLRQLQTGNPRMLKLERAIWGDRELETLLHAYFREWVIGGQSQSHRFDPSRNRDTEWFEPSGRVRMLEDADAIWLAQSEDMDLADEVNVGQLMTELGFCLVLPDEVRLLGEGMGYVTGRSRLR